MGDRAKTQKNRHPPSDLTSSRRLSLLSGSDPDAGCWAIELSESGSTSAVLGSETSLEEQGQADEELDIVIKNQQKSQAM